LLVAGAGFGKTTALEEALSLRGGAAAWVRCSELDRDPGRLLADLVHALAGAAPGAADALGERLAGAPLQIDPAVASRELAGELDALWSATEGWPLGVALSAASAGAPAPGALGSTALAGFLEEELLGPLGGELRAALLESSLAPDLDAAMLAALGLPTDLLDEAGRHGVPLRSVDSGARVAYHPLVRDLLRARLMSERP